MRNWHHNIIRLDSALNLLPNNYTPTIVSVSEDTVQFEVLLLNNNWVDPPNYRAIHPSFNDVFGFRKIILRNYFTNNDNIPTHNSTSLTKSSLFKEDSNNFNFHAIAVTGIIASNNLGNNLKGITANSAVISTQNVFNSLLIAKINKISSKNIVGKYIGKEIFSLADNKVTIPSIYEENFLPYESWSASIINQSQFYTVEDRGKFLNYVNSFIFMLQELFAYGRDGRGVLYVCGSGNGQFGDYSEAPQGIEIGIENFVQAKSSKSFVVGASYINLNENNFEALSNGYYNRTLPIPEEVAQYSNYGQRLDIVAPSSPNGNLKADEFGVYSPSPLKGGDFGVNANELLIKRVFIISSNKKSLTLNNIFGVFSGQTVEIGNETSFLHEFKIIKSVNIETNTIFFENKLKFTQDLYNETNLNTVIVEVKITVLKIPLGEKITQNKYKISSRIGLMKSLNDENNFQKVFIYNKDETEERIDTNSEIKVRLINKVRSIEKSPIGDYFIIEFVNSFNYLPNLFLIPDQMEIKVKSIEDSYTFQCLENYYLEGFFVGQKIKVGDFKTSITEINYNNNYFVTKHYKVPIGEQFTIRSLAYGSFINSFGGTSAATPIVSGLAGLVLSANPSLNAAEIKHILKATTDKIGDVNYNDAPSDNTKYNYGYTIHEKYGTGRVNAQKAIQLALDWNNITNPTQTVLKPRLEIADKIVGTTITNVPVAEIVDSPDIWLSTLTNSNTTPVAPFNEMNTSQKQYINIKVRNTGNRQSFKECDLRVLIAFTDVANPAFPFPAMWYNQTDVKLLAVKEIPIIAPFGQTVVQIEWNNIGAFWNANNLLVNGFRKRAYILAHIAPFDGLDAEVMRDNIRNNKQLTCKEIIVTHNSVSDRTAYIPANNLIMTLGSEIVEKNFTLSMENVLNSDLDILKIKATKKNRANGALEVVQFKKTGSNWALESGNPSWITFQTPTVLNANHANYKNAVFPHVLKINDALEEIKLEIV